MITGSDITVNVIASVIASAILLAAGVLWGKYKERRKFGRNLEEYDFYPYTINRDNVPEFNLKDFRLGTHYFLKNNDYTAARQLIFIGEQNNVRGQLEPAEQKVYAKLFEKYEGRKIARPSIWKIMRGWFGSSGNPFQIPGSKYCCTIWPIHRTRSLPLKTMSRADICATVRRTSSSI